MPSKRAVRLRHLARILRQERMVARAALAAIQELGKTSLATLEAAGMDASVLDSRDPTWRAAVETHLVPVVTDVFVAGFTANVRPALTAAAEMDAEDAFALLMGDRSLSDRYASRYLTEATNRLYGVSDTVFSQIARSLEEGRQREYPAYRTPGGMDVPARVGESIPELSARVDALLSDEQRWKNRATVIARTEVIGANNAGSAAAAAYSAGVLGFAEDDVVKEWLATPGPRTRPTHQTADGQVVKGMSTPFIVGGAFLQQPGDPAGPAKEVIQCRCTTLYHYPGDPDYPADLAPPAALSPVPEPGLFTAESLESTLDPGRRRTATAVRKDLESTPAGSLLSAAIKQFTETRGGVANLRKAIARAADGSASKAVTDRARAFVSAMNTYPTEKVPALYRGIAVKVDDTPEWWDAFEGQFQPGQRIDLNASSFSSNEKKAAEFSSMIGGTRRASSNYTAVRMVLEGNPHALPVESLSKFKSEREWITGGTFEVVDYLPATKQQPYYRVVVRQVKSLENP